LPDGSRKITSIQELTGMEGEVVTLQEIFGFEQVSVDAEGKVRGKFRAKGVRPRWVEKFKALGIPVSYDIFDTSRSFEV
jgi:pilus assembly protein CpaF